MPAAAAGAGFETINVGRVARGAAGIRMSCGAGSEATASDPTAAAAMGMVMGVDAGAL